MRIALYLLAVWALTGCGGNDAFRGPDDGDGPTGGADPTVSGLDRRPANPTCLAPGRPLDNMVVGLVDAFPGQTFTNPVLVLQAPGDTDHLYVVSQPGRIFRVTRSAPHTSTLFADLSARVDSGPNEGGLLGMAFHPGYAVNGTVYLSYTTSDEPVLENGANFRSRVSRFSVRPDRTGLDTASEFNLLSLAQPYGNHNGGHIAFGPLDGYLYIGFGDGGSGNDPENRAQNLQTWHGKLLRIDVSVKTATAGAPYTVPANNPYVQNADALPEIYATGLRNPWRFGFDRSTGELWLGDVGQSTWEEVNRVTAGGNYGWRVREGAQCNIPANCNPAGLTDPVVAYDHSGGRCSITGGTVYRGNALPGLVGQYIYGDYCSGEIWSIPTGTANPTPQLLLDSTYTISSFGEDAYGELYVIRHGGSGRVYRLAATAGTPTGAIAAPANLTDTGCVQPNNPTQPASGLIPYDINVPFWSDGAAKQRHLAIPDGSNIGYDTSGHLTFPPGAVLMKQFRHQGQLVETRLLMRHPDGAWVGYSYEWNAAQSQATRIDTTITKTVAGLEWTFPGSGDCQRCHNDAAVFTLGTELTQLERDLTYPATGRRRNQLDTLDAVGLFSVPLPASTTALPSPTDSSLSLDHRARAYLHANCSHCHRPGGGTPAALDLRYSTPFSSTGLCFDPVNGDLGVEGARIILPQDPDRSLLYLRMTRRGPNTGQMPPLATALADSDGAQLIRDWIDGFEACP